jgi:hypothetical protein
MDPIQLLYSAEVRWFVKGLLPESALAWFLQDAPTDPLIRIDRYLLFPGCASVGVKEREGKFEIKARCSSGEIARLAAHAVGRVEGWAKWSYERPPVTPWLEALALEPAGWINVCKARRLLQFSLERGAPQRVGLAEQPRQGCSIELTSIQARGGDWWSVGLEAFGSKARLQANLRIVAAAFFSARGTPPPLGLTDSCSYPAWLNHFSQAGE